VHNNDLLLKYILTFKSIVEARNYFAAAQFLRKIVAIPADQLGPHGHKLILTKGVALTPDPGDAKNWLQGLIL